MLGRVVSGEEGIRCSRVTLVADSVERKLAAILNARTLVGYAHLLEQDEVRRRRPCARSGPTAISSTQTRGYSAVASAA